MSTVLEMKDEWVKTARLFGDVETVMTDALLTTYLQSQIRACEQEIGIYELKYRMTFAEFAEAWEQGAIAGRWAHAVERDYMEWEGLEEERQQWLARLRALQIEW